MGDELILIGTLKLLLAQNKEPIVVSQNPEFLKSFCAQFIDVNKVVFIYELPRGIRSLIYYIKGKHYTDFKYFYSCESIIL